MPDRLMRQAAGALRLALECRPEFALAALRARHPQVEIRGGGETFFQAAWSEDDGRPGGTRDVYVTAYTAEEMAGKLDRPKPGWGPPG